MITKIASMKNPPVLWPDSEVMVVERAMTQNKE
jgi:hypothetical protein